MPIIADIALIAWPLVALILFSRMEFTRALSVTVIFGYLFLPTDSHAMNIQGLPPYDKSASVALAAVLGALFFGRRAPDPRTGRDGLSATILRVLFIALLLSSALTWVTNIGAIDIGGRFRPGMAAWDALSWIAHLLIVFTPFLLAQRYMTTPEAHRTVLRTLVVAGVAYSLLVLFEVRMSPQLSNRIYGFFPHSWLQHVRDGGFRPIVFLSHGLSVGFFLFSVAVAAFAQMRTEQQPTRRRFLWAGLWLLPVLFLSKNFGAVGLAILFIPLVLWAGKGIQIRLAALIAIVFLSYPFLRQNDIVPVTQALNVVRTISTDRARSLGVRLNHEVALLHRALERPAFGWGRYGRSRIYTDRGVDVSISDGGWIILMGERGWFGYLAYFGLMGTPLLLLGRARRRKGDIPHSTLGLTAIMAGNLVYLIPNTTLGPIGFLVAGTLAGFVRYDVEARDEAKATGTLTPRRRRSRYTRFSPPEPSSS